jgi:hypothetical protein
MNEEVELFTVYHSGGDAQREGIRLLQMKTTQRILKTRRRMFSLGRVDLWGRPLKIGECRRDPV